MKISELIGHQIEFETTRVGNGPVVTQTLWEYNKTPGFRINRLQQEVDELKMAEDLGEGDFKRLVEATDIVIFTAGIMGEICVRNGWPLKYVDILLRDKMAQNMKKYTEENFAGRTVEEGLIYSREQWNKQGGSS